jgi:hypothetical protein
MFAEDIGEKNTTHLLQKLQPNKQHSAFLE